MQWIRFQFAVSLTGILAGTTTLFCAMAPSELVAQTYAPPLSGEFGAIGPYGVAVNTFTNPNYPTANGQTLTVSVYHPTGAINTTLPTIFFAHGFTSPVGDAANYDGLLTNLASQGYNVVFSPFEGGISPNIPRRFDELTTGFEAAVGLYGLNTAQVGFAGHSYGSGFLPAVIQHEMMGVTNQAGTPGHAWGSTSAFMYSMAPGYAYGGLPATQSIAFPSNINVVEQAFYDDTAIADPRIAMDVFYNVTIPSSQKDFVTVYGDDHGTPAQVANHFLPNSGIDSTSLQAWGILRHIDALAAYTFHGDLAAKEIALGGGTPVQGYMGKWSDNTPVHPLAVTDWPSPNSYDNGNYTVDWEKIANPRRNFTLAPEPATLVLAGLGAGSLLFARRRRTILAVE